MYLARFRMNAEKPQVVEIKLVNRPTCGYALEKGESIFEGKLNYVVENTCRKNVTFRGLQLY